MLFPPLYRFFSENTSKIFFVCTTFTKNDDNAEILLDVSNNLEIVGRKPCVRHGILSVLTAGIFHGILIMGLGYSTSDDIGNTFRTENSTIYPNM